MRMRKWLLTLLSCLATAPLWAQEAGVSGADTAWVLISTALVLLMTPGLAFFYGGMVGKKNVVATLFQNLVAISVLGVLWAVIGYSLSFSHNIAGLLGNFGHFMMAGVGQEAKEGLTIPHILFALFQGMFAIITPALIIGAFAERVQLKAWIGFSILWSLVVYYPVCHWVWGTGGWIAALGGQDFAGGLVVHMTAGFSALIFALYLGQGKEFLKTRPYDTGMIALGTSLLFFGWFGFNAGSALAASGLAAQAFGTTFLSACACSIAWCLFDIIKGNKPTLTGFCIAVVVGLVVITPAAGFVSFGAAIFMGLIAGVVCNFFVSLLKNRFSVDDRLDVFACHGVGGTLGTLMVGIFGSKAVNSLGADGLIYGNFNLLKSQLIAVLAVAIYSMVATYVVLKVLSLVVSVKSQERVEVEGLDSSDHGETINNYLKVV